MWCIGYCVLVIVHALCCYVILSNWCIVRMGKPVLPLTLQRTRDYCFNIFCSFHVTGVLNLIRHPTSLLLELHAPTKHSPSLLSHCIHLHVLCHCFKY